MKKALSLLLALVLCLSLCACGGSNDEPETTEAQTEIAEDSSLRETTPKGYEIYYVGEEVSSDYFPFTVKEATFSEQVVSLKSNEFLTPTTDTGSDTYGADKDYQWLYYEVEYTYKGKSTLSQVDALCKPTVYYGEYEFNSEYFTFGKINNSWYILLSDYEGVGHPLQRDLSFYSSYKYEPMEDAVYVIRGVIKVPEKAIADTETPIYLKLLNVAEASPSAINMMGYYFEIER